MQKRIVKSHEEVLTALKSLDGSLPEKLTDVSIEIKATGVHLCWDVPDEVVKEAKPEAAPKKEPANKPEAASKQQPKTEVKEALNKAGTETKPQTKKSN